VGIRAGQWICFTLLSQRRSASWAVQVCTAFDYNPRNQDDTLCRTFNVTAGRVTARGTIDRPLFQTF
jgi:hypothetical protein